MKLFKSFDSRGRESITLFFVRVSWSVVTLKFLVAGNVLGALGPQPPMGAGEFGTAVAAILLIWLGREWTEKRSTGTPSGG